jgi:hypothetical protein
MEERKGEKGKLAEDPTDVSICVISLNSLDQRKNKSCYKQ